jgi:hypothetical protein
MEVHGTKRKLRSSGSTETREVYSRLSKLLPSFRITGLSADELFSQYSPVVPSQLNVMRGRKRKDHIVRSRRRTFGREYSLSRFIRPDNTVGCVTCAIQTLIFPHDAPYLSTFFLARIQAFTLLVLYTIWDFDSAGLRVHASYQLSFAFEYCVMPRDHRMLRCNSSTATTIVQPPLFQRLSCNSEATFFDKLS